MSGTTKVKGIKIELGGVERIVPPLSLGAMEQLHEPIKAFMANVSDLSNVRVVVDAAHAALKRNYPEISREEVADAIGLDNMNEVFEAIMDVSGLKRKSLEAGEQSAGEA